MIRYYLNRKWQDIQLKCTKKDKKGEKERNKMKKFCGILIALFLTFLIGSEPAKANQDFLSEVVKKEAERFCSSIAFNSLDETQRLYVQQGFYEEGIELAASKKWNDQTATSAKGSKIVMPVAKYKSYGYCHIYDYHMKNANTKKKHEVQIGGFWKSQFQYAHFPDTAMDIAMEVIDGTDEIVSDPDNPNRYIKTFFSYKEGQRVRVALQRGNTWGGYNNYDWVLVSMYPVF